VQLSAALDVRQTRRLRRDESIAEAELFAQFDSVGLLNEERIRSAVDHEPGDFFAEDDTAGPRGPL